MGAGPVTADSHVGVRDMKKDPFKPEVSLLCKLGSIVVHVDEGLGPQGHPFDTIALRSLIEDPDVKTWLVQMDKLAMLPKKRA